MYKLVLASLFLASVICDDLVSVVVIYRHGDRTPIRLYPNDPYQNSSYWPVGFGQLTNLGKMQHYLLGKWLRTRYNNFLSARYSEKDFYIRSTDVDRTLMSAEANLAGLYPPHKDQVWDPAIPWQPIPIHTTPELEDNLVSMKKNCPKYNYLLDELYKTEYFVNVSETNRDLYQYLTKNSGDRINNLEKLEYLYSTLKIESFFNFTLPVWTKSVFPNAMKPWADMSFAVPTWTPELARFKTGTLFYEIIEHFVNATRNGTDYRKFLVFSAHDITISNVLNTIGAFQWHSPPYASTILFELRKSYDSFYLNIFYKNSSQVQNITAKGCHFDCRLFDFIDILKAIVLTRTEWDLECQQGWYDSLVFSNVQYLIYGLTFGSLSLISFAIFYIIYKSSRQAPKDGLTAYTQLPSDEVA